MLVLDPGVQHLRGVLVPPATSHGSCKQRIYPCRSQMAPQPEGTRRPCQSGDIAKSAVSLST